eukprot:TRINITY_DN1531_c1_g2_i2.p1 TRINITY_DN1531_c1_g2~~TRINITY_DN1531_c1_g2_i2.p1  ORF type:complete len:345 (+),score=26.60 TRINITY_DN1531_c1_g2_i2:33-1037(+)
MERDQFFRNFPFLNEIIEKKSEYTLTKEDIETIAQIISTSDSIQRFGISVLHRRRTSVLPQDPSSSVMFFPVFHALKLNTAIEVLDLRNWNLVDSSTPMIADVIMLNNTITHLDLSNCRFGPEVMKAIRMNSTIQILDISDCRRNDDIFTNTRGTSLGLTSLNIAKNNFTFKHVAEWLKDNINLTSLTLSSEQMKDNGRDAFCEWFSKRSTLTELHLVNIQKSFQGAEKCLKLHGKLQKFSFKDASYYSEEEAFSVLESLSFNKDLRHLDLSFSFQNQEVYSIPIIRLIDSLPLLTEINLAGNHLDHNIGDVLRRKSLLTTLNLRGLTTSFIIK